jgi:hypothetical protein
MKYIDPDNSPEGDPEGESEGIQTDALGSRRLNE